MLDINSLASRTVQFLSIYAFDKRERNANGSRIIDEYRSLQDGIVRVSPDTIYEPVSDTIQPSRAADFIVFDIGSGLRSPYVFNLLKERPGVEVVKVDKLSRDDITGELEFEDEIIDRSKVVFHTQVNNRPEDSAENWVNRLLEANVYRAVNYAHVELSPRGKSRVPQYGYKARGKRVIVTGIKNPGLLALSTVDIANHYNADLCLITPSKLEGLTEEEMDYLLGSFGDRYLTRSGRKQFKALLQDPEKEKRGVEKFDFRNEVDRSIGIALKQVAVLALANRLVDSNFNVELGLIDYRSYNNRTSYNDPSHVIVGETKKFRDLEEEDALRERQMAYLDRHPIAHPSEADDWVLRELRQRFGPTAQDSF